jgi:L-fucose isomerase-like protein
MNLDFESPINLKFPTQIGVITLGNPLKDMDMIRYHEQEMVAFIRDLGVTPVLGETIVIDRNSLKGVIAQLQCISLNGILVILGSYSSDEIFLEIRKNFNCPLVMWAPEEKLLPEAFPPFASLVGMTQSAGTLKRLGFKPYPFYGAISLPRLHNELSRMVNVISTFETLRHSRIGRVGPGCPGMLDTQFDALDLRQQLGIEIVDIPIQDLINLNESVSNDLAVEIIPRIQAIDPNSGATEKDFLDSLKIYIALRMLIAKYELTAITVRCWPELKNCGVVAPCLALSLLTNQGIPAGCEGDALGAASMLIGQLQTGKPAFFGDFVAIDDVSDEALCFHCGAGAAGLSDNLKGLNLKTHSRPTMWKPGVTVEFPVRPGEMTYLRLGQAENGFRLLNAKGIAQPHQSFCRGTTLRFKPEIGAREFLAGLMTAGAEHHLIVAQGDISLDLDVLCDLWGIRNQKLAV